MNARLYIRVSHDDQVKYGLSLETQLETLTKYCMENRININGVYSDEGVSGGSIKKRNGLKKMLSDSSPGEILLFTKLDRFSRNLLDANIIVKDLEKKNVSIKAVLEDDIDTSTADGKFIFNLKLSLAEREREKTSERIKDVFAYRIKNGFSVSGNYPLGYTKSEDGKYKVVEEEAECIRQLFKYYDKHQSMNKTTKWWNNTFPQYKNSYVHLRDGKLKNQIYIGKHPSGMNDTFCEPIIDEALFYRVQEKLKKNIKKSTSNRVYLFSSLIRCGQCGNMMYANVARQDYVIYRCNNSKINHRCPNTHVISEKRIENVLIAEFKSLLNNSYVDFAIKNANNNAMIDENIKKTSSKIERLKDLYVGGIIERMEFDKKYKSLSIELEELKRSKDESPKTVQVIQEFKNIKFEELYNKLNRENKSIFWHRFIKEIVFDGKNIKVLYQ